jgi:hypothetical protein
MCLYENILGWIFFSPILGSPLEPHLETCPQWILNKCFGLIRQVSIAYQSHTLGVDLYKYVFKS